MYYVCIVNRNKMEKIKKLSVKERVIEAASRLFYQEGYNQTGINQIISEASVAKASMYQHFRSKEDIAVAYLQERHIRWMGNLNHFVAKKANGKDKLVGSFDYLLHWLEDVDYRGCGFQNIICDIPLDHQKIKDQVQLHKSDLRDWIHKLIKEAYSIPEKEAEALGDEILVLQEGAIILSQIQKESWPISTAKITAQKVLA